jgi:aspartyl-tRNA(Asn)/glutamyl-tRNA(Gln) amidotransferase subunit A
LKLKRQITERAETSRSIVKNALDRIEDPSLQGRSAFIRTYNEEALLTANYSDALRNLAHGARSELDGLPVSIKDLFDVAGITTLAGSKVLQEAPAAAADAVAVRRLRGSGAVIVGSTNMSEFAYSPLGLNPHYGNPRNPVDPKRISGGSSSGAAISIAEGMAAVAIGSDTGGSIRIPAACCGIVGFKPTQYRVPLTGTVPVSETFDSIGPLAATVTDCAIADAVISGISTWLPEMDSVSNLRLGLPSTAVLEGMDPTVTKAFERAISRLSSAGARVIDVDIPQFAEVIASYAAPGFPAIEAFAWHEQMLRDKAKHYDPNILKRIRAGEGVSAAAYLSLRKTRARLIAGVQSVTADFDAILMPTLQIVAPLKDEISDQTYMKVVGSMVRNPAIANYLDRCAISIPCHENGELPVGLSLLGEHGGDIRLLEIAYAVEKTLMPMRRLH